MQRYCFGKLYPRHYSSEASSQMSMADMYQIKQYEGKIV